MGFLDKILGSKESFPPLPSDGAAASQIDEIKAPLESLLSKVSDRMEVVPADQDAFVLLGKPPQRFGLAWIHDGQVTGLKELAETHRLSQVEIGKLLVRLGEAYQNASNAQRYSAEIAGKTLVVTPSKDLGQEMQQIIQRSLH